MSRSTNRLAAPRPGKREGDLARGRSHQPRKLSGSRRRAAGEVGAQARAPSRWCRRAGGSRLRVRPGAPQAPARDTPRHRSSTRATCARLRPERAQCRDLAGARHLDRTIGAPSGRGAQRREQAALLVEAQRLRGDAELSRSLGRVQELCGMAHESPLGSWDHDLIGADPGAGSIPCRRIRRSPVAAFTPGPCSGRCAPLPEGSRSGRIPGSQDADRIRAPGS